MISLALAFYHTDIKKEKEKPKKEKSKSPMSKLFGWGNKKEA